MKRKGAKIFDNSEWIEEYSTPITEEWMVSKKTGTRMQLSGDSPQLRKSRDLVLEFMKEHQEVLNQFQDLTLNYARTLELEWPTCYPVIVKAAGELNDRSYVNARVFWPMVGRKKRELRFYICPYTDNLDIKSDSFKVLMQEKVAMEIKKREEDLFFVQLDENNKENQYKEFFNKIVNKSKK